jgi:hypothetical protein
MMSNLRTNVIDFSWNDPGRLSSLLIRLSVAAVLLAITSWLALNHVAPGVLKDAYEGRSIAILNSLISGQRDHPVDEYLAALSQIARTVALSLLDETTQSTNISPPSRKLRALWRYRCWRWLSSWACWPAQPAIRRTGAR